LWYLGPGNEVDEGYAAGTVFTLGAANGATAQPTYVIVSGSNELSLDCTNCANPNATATAGSSNCQSYDVVVETSYGGFMSDPFYIFINRPWNNVAADDQPAAGWCDPTVGPWVYSCANWNGYMTHVNYTTSGLCATDPPMTNYHLNEQFPWGTTPEYAGENWPAGQPGSFYVFNTTQWYDKIWIDNGGAAPGAPATCGVVGAPVPCIPPFTNPGVGPHTLVQQIQQNWFVGNWVTGVGARVQSDSAEMYTDSGWHTNIVTPNP
jgi:hypothetical protein